MFTNQLVRFSRAGLIAIAAAPLAAGPALAAPEGRLTVAITSFQSENLDPALGLTTDRYYQGHGYEFLVGTAPSGALEPPRGLATSWQGTPDAKTFTLKLRKGVKWHDGKDFTADDVVFSFDERYKAEDTICTFCSAVKRNVERVEAPDSHSVIFHLKNPDVSFPGVLSSRDGDLAVLPRHNFRKTADGKGYEMVGDPIGTGPWQFVEWARGESITFRANTDYWDQDRVPEFAELVVLKRPEASTRLAMVRTGEADMAFIDTGQAREARAADLNAMGIEGASLTVLSLAGGDKSEMLCNKLDFRKAMFHAIDMEAIVERLFPEGTGVQYAASVYTPPALGFDPDLEPYPFDPDDAKQRLEAAGYDGRPVKLWQVILSNSPETPEILQLVAGYLEAVGIKTEITPIEQPQFYRGKVFQDPQPWETEYACHLHVNVPFPRPFVMQNLRVSFISRPAGGVLAYYPDYDHADNAYRSLSQITTLEELDGALREFNRESHAAYGFYPVVARSLTFAVGERVAGWKPGSYGLAWHLETVTQAR
jgi:peptide/nickel transport system substrate-binding protein